MYKDFIVTKRNDIGILKKIDWIVTSVYVYCEFPVFYYRGLVYSCGFF